MILAHSVKVCLATRPCDPRKSFDTLSVLVRDELREDPLSRKVSVGRGTFAHQKEPQPPAH